MARGLPKLSTGIYSSTRRSKLQWHKRFGKSSMDPTVKVSQHDGPCTHHDTHLQTNRPQAQISVSISVYLTVHFFGASARPRFARSGSALTLPLHLTFYG